jgi:hypothetical protein
MKFRLLIEGYTERKALPSFLKRWLDPRLNKSVGISTDRFDGWAELVKDVPKIARMYLDSPTASRDVIAVIALIDLYGPTIYPEDKKTPEERYAWAKRHIEDQVGREKFRQYFAVHETEAWLLSDPKLFSADIRKALPAKIAKPETVNFDTPPGKLLENLYLAKLRRKYKKVTDGDDLFEKLDPEVAYEKCPYLRAMLDDMLQLARDAGL